MTPHSSDLARRIAQRRHELGLSREELARRAEMDPDYLDYLEHSTVSSMLPGVVLRLAAALETTAAHLRGGDVDRPPGPGRAGAHPQLVALSSEECEAHLVGGGVGRFVFLAPRGPVALPVNFRFLDGDVVFHTRTEGVLAAAAGSTVGFEVDQIDEAMSEGWSVLITGSARLVDDPAELERLARLDVSPWPGGHRDAVIRVVTETISGRVISQQAST
jgi:hypothetical protein